LCNNVAVSEEEVRKSDDQRIGRIPENVVDDTVVEKRWRGNAREVEKTRLRPWKKIFPSSR
jgi:hypothetical protein